MTKYGCYSQSGLFESMERGMRAKMEIVRRYPDMASFTIKAFYEKDPEVNVAVQESYHRYFNLKVVPEEQVQLLLIMEIMEQQRLADASRLSNLAHGAVLIGIAGKYPVSGIDDGLLPLRWLFSSRPHPLSLLP